MWQQATGCQRCPQLAATRNTVVFGSGNADADLMFVGEAPGAREDEQGLPFVGQAGRLLDRLLEEIGLTRADVFIANVLKCRPPGNRDPLPQEIDSCQDYLFRQLELIEPKVVCSLGNFSTKLLRARSRPASRACTGARRSARSGRGRCGCTRSTTPRRRSTRRRCWRRCAPTSPACPTCWRSTRRRSPSRRRPSPSCPSRSWWPSRSNPGPGRARGRATPAADQLGLF